MPFYEIESTGNGAFWTVTRLADGAALFMQGDEANAFASKIGNTHDAYTEDDVCVEYDDVFVVNEGS